MQKFHITIEITVNTAATVSEAEIAEEFEQIVQEFDSGTATVLNVVEQ